MRERVLALARPSRWTVAAAVVVALGAPGVVSAQDFDPRGRHHSPGTRQTSPHPTPHPTPLGAPNPALPTAAAPDGAPPSREDPSGQVLIERYTRVVLSQPASAFPLQRLAQLYRSRDGNIARLITDFESRASASGPDAYAATTALAGLYKLDGRPADAAQAYEKAIAIKPGDASARVALAHLLEERGDTSGARAQYSQALMTQSVRADKEQTLRALMTLALDAKDWAAAKEAHRQLLALDATNLFVRAELARELSNRGEFVRAEEELKGVVAAAAGDNRALAPALKELGRVQAKNHENKEALATLDRAITIAGPATALRAEIDEVIVSVYRADQNLAALIARLEAEHAGDPGRLALLGGLYEETGDTAKAMASYRRALALNPRQVDLHLRLIRLLQSSGEIDRAISEYEGLIRSAPNNPQFVFEETDALLQRGDHARALSLVTALEARARGDEDILSRVAEFYTRIGEGDRALKVLQRLAASGVAGDPGPIVDLGDRYFQDGQLPLALQTWKRLLIVIQPRAKALAALGSVYLEHDRLTDAVSAYEEAIQLDPGQLAYRKELATAYERTHAYRQAEQIYEEIVPKALGARDDALARECRTRIVALWGLERTLEQQLPGLQARFTAAPPDMEAGRTLAEVYAHLRRLGDAEGTLRRLMELAPGDVESHLALERVLIQENRVGDAIAVLEKLAVLEPKRARELYQRMAQYALQTYRDDDAIKYAARAVELSPDDAEGHRRLGEMYRSRQDTDHAIAEFRAAIAKNDRLYLVYFELADLLLSKAETDAADRLFRAVVRGAPDEDLVARAARLSMQINLERGTLQSLEQDLLPLAIGNPQRPVYRRLLVEIYGSLAFGLMQRVRHGESAEADAARSELSRIGARAIKPLLDALASQNVTEQRIAIDVLAYVDNKNAALPLFAFATSSAELALRERAMLACATLADPALIPKIDELVFPRDGSPHDAVPRDRSPHDEADASELAESIGVAALWAVARINAGAALPLLRRAAERATAPAMRAVAVLGLGMARDTASIKDVAEMARAVDAGMLVRAAAAYALGDLNAQSEAPSLLELAANTDGRLRRMATLALARMAAVSRQEPVWREPAARAMADEVFAGAGDDSRSETAAQDAAQTAVAALAILATRGEAASGWARRRDGMPPPDTTLDVEALLDHLAPSALSTSDRQAALLAFAEPLQRAALAALSTSAGRARAVLDALGHGEGEFLPFVGPGAEGAAARAARDIGESLAPALVPLATNPDPEIRARALRLVARNASDAATAALVAGLQDPNEAVQRVALSAVGAGPPNDRVEAAVEALLSSADAMTDGTTASAERGAPVRNHDDRGHAPAHVASRADPWAIRVLAVQALGRLGAAGARSVSGPLAATAERDPYSLVRQAALEAWAAFDPRGAGPIARQMAASDPEPRVREAARALAR